MADRSETNTPELVALGMAVIDHHAWVTNMPTLDGAAVVEREEWQGGGMAANLAVAAARLEANVGLIAAIGDDDIGQWLLRELSTERVDVQHIQRRINAATTEVLLLGMPDAYDRMGVLFHLATLLSLLPEEAPADYIQNARIYFTDLFPVTAGLHGAELAREAGVLVASDLQISIAESRFHGITMEVARQAVEVSDILLPSVHAILDLTGASHAEAAAEKLARDHPYKLFAITLGSDGALLLQGKSKVHIPAFPVQVVDSLGAGDAFHAAFLVAHCLWDWDLERAGRFAAAAGALTCRREGARTAPTRREIEGFLRVQQ